MDAYFRVNTNEEYRIITWSCHAALNKVVDHENDPALAEKIPVAEDAGRGRVCKGVARGGLTTLQ